MKKILFALFSFAVLFFSCDSDDESSPLPTDVSNVSVEPRVGGALIKWTIPADRNFLYLQSRYDKNGRVISTNSSIYTDSVLISGLINKLEYVFELQTFNVDGQGGSILQTSSVRPIRRANEIIYSIDDATDVALTVDMLTTYTQESTEGGKANLIDGEWVQADSGKTIDVTNRIFAPNEQEVVWAESIMTAYADAIAEGKGIVVVDGKLIENLHVENARRILALTQAIGKMTSA